MDQRDLAGASARDMAIERVIAAVDHAAGEPASIGADRGIEDLLRRLDPVDLARGFSPEALGIAERAGIHLVVGAFLVNVHGVSPDLSVVMAGLDPAIHLKDRESFEERWMPGSSPA